MPENQPKAGNTKQAILIITTIISVLISIGAYSKDSIFVRYFLHKNKFSVTRLVVIDGTATSGFYANARFYKKHASQYGELLAPIHLLQYINIRNDSEDPQSIGGIKIEIKQNGEWVPLPVLSPNTGTIFNTVGGTGGLTHATTVDFLGDLLESNLAKGVLSPHGIVSGWVFLGLPEGTYKDLERASLRLRIFSGFGENETHIVNNIDLPPDATPVNPVGFKFSKEKYDLSRLEILSENEAIRKVRSSP